VENKQRIWDYSKISSFQTCRKKYYWEHVRHLRPKTKGTPLLFGGAIHEALDVYYTHDDKEKGTIEAIKKFKSEYSTPEGDELRTVENGEKMLMWYFVKYKDEPFKTIGKPEQGFVFFIGDILYGGRLDLPVEWDGQLWIMEHKTTTRLTGGYFDQFELDKQPTGYIIALEEFTGRKCAGAIINAMEPWKDVKRVSARTKQPEDHFLRKPLTRSDELKERFRYNVQAIVRDIKWCEENDEFQEAEKKEVCYYYNRPCPYLQLCTYGESPRVLERDYQVEVWEPYKDSTIQEREVKNA
jgi:hypothetical protein